MIETFEVLAEPNRRRILDLLREEERPVGELVRLLAASQPAVSKHLRVLREAGLVEVRVDAQRRLYRVRPEPLRETDGWVDGFFVNWVVVPILNVVKAVLRTLLFLASTLCAFPVAGAETQVIRHFGALNNQRRTTSVRLRRSPGGAAVLLRLLPALQEAEVVLQLRLLLQVEQVRQARDQRADVGAQGGALAAQLQDPALHLVRARLGGETVVPALVDLQRHERELVRRGLAAGHDRLSEDVVRQPVSFSREPGIGAGEGR